METAAVFFLFVVSILFHFPQPGQNYGHIETDSDLKYFQGNQDQWGNARDFNRHAFDRRNKLFFELTGLGHMERLVIGHPRRDHQYDHTVRKGNQTRQSFLFDLCPKWCW